MHMKTDTTATEAIADLQAGPGHDAPRVKTLVNQPDEAADDWFLAWSGPMKRGIPIHPFWD